MQTLATPATTGRPPRASPGLVNYRLRRARSRKAKVRSKRPKANLLAVSDSELKRSETLLLMQAGIISPREAQKLLGLSRSQIYKLLSKFASGGAAAIASKKRGRPSNRAFPDALRQTVLEIIEREYWDYGPTLVSEMLLDLHDIKLSKETLRIWMMAAGLWVNNRAERRRLHQPRRRMESYGDLIQVDGSDHDWFEGRSSRCTAMVYVDDATGRLQHLSFFRSEDRDAYFESTVRYIEAHGRPVRFVTDRHAAVYSPDGPTEYGIALDQLNIVHSVARSPQSKGRVERAHRTIQDRLTKALRRKRINTREAANAYIPEFIQEYNRRFSRRARREDDNHRAMEGPAELHRAFARRYPRRVSKQLTLSFEGSEYIIQASAKEFPEIGPWVTVERRIDGTIAVFGNCGELKVLLNDWQSSKL